MIKAMIGVFGALSSPACPARGGQTQALLLLLLQTSLISATGIAVCPAYSGHLHCLEARGHLWGDMGKRPRQGKAGLGGSGGSLATIPWV